MPTGKLLIFFGLVLIVAGLFITFGDKLYFLGKIPGDIRIERQRCPVRSLHGSLRM